MVYINKNNYYGLTKIAEGCENKMLTDMKQTLVYDAHVKQATE